jgi:tetratricopeptide (TPR) repeat protein
VALAAVVDANIELGHYDEAETQLDRLLGLRPGVEAYSRLSYLHQLRGEDDAALEAMFLARASASDATAAGARIDDLLGELYYELGELNAAVEYHQLAVDAAPGRYEVALARSLAASGDVAEAHELVADALEADAGDTGALMLLVELETAGLDADDGGPADGQPDGDGSNGPSPAGPTTTRIDQAVEALVEAAAGELAAGFGTDPSQALFEATYADPGAALELAEVIHGRRPDNIKADHALAWALHRNGRSEDALEPLAGALRFDTSDAVLHRHAAEIFEAVGQDGPAAEHRARAAQLRPPMTG